MPDLHSVRTPPSCVFQIHFIAVELVYVSINHSFGGFFPSNLDPPWDIFLPNVASHWNGVMEITLDREPGDLGSSRREKEVSSGILQQPIFLLEGLLDSLVDEELPLGRLATWLNTVIPHCREILQWSHEKCAGHLLQDSTDRKRPEQANTETESRPGVARGCQGLGEGEDLGE